MAPITNGRLLFNEIPTGLPEPGRTTVYDTSETIDLENETLNGGVLVKTLCLSADPYMRVRMRPVEVESYLPAFIIGKPINSGGIAKVVRSENEGFKAGDYVLGHIDHAEYSIATVFGGLYGLTVFRPEPGVSLSAYLGAAGMPGQTAYCGWKEYANAKAGETVFVSGGAGPVGSIVIQLAKEEGLKVITSAGTDEKVQFCREVGADIAFNYKTESTEAILEKEGPLHVYWDNVGGTTLDAALGVAATDARFIECGAISTYNSKDGVLMKNIDQIYARCIKLYGFLVAHLAPKWQKEFFEVIPKKLASGEFKYKEDITRGLENAGEALREVQTGKNSGKKVIVVADD